MADREPVSALPRRRFLAATSAALVGLVPKRGRTIEGGFVHESDERGHRLRDRTPVAEPTETRRSAIVIVGGGIAGLSAAWRLAKRGFDDFVLLEMESTAGGNARWGENAAGVFPWGAHYVPVPGAGAPLVRELFADLGVLDGASWDERHLVHAPKERLFIHGRWQDGLEPLVGPTRRDRDQMSRFADRMRELRASRRFAVPMGEVRDAASMADDTLSMAAWLDREKLDSPWLRWTVDYACRDDYGALAADVSAWAGLHYFAAREPHEGETEGPLTWPEGNGWIVRRLLQRFGPRVQTDVVVSRVERRGRQWRIVGGTVEWLAEAVILATPLQVATRIVQGAPQIGVSYSPWFVANVTLDRWPRDQGPGVAWDNVMFDSRSLGFVVATHQLLRRHVPRSVWTCYWALAYESPAAARRWLLAQSWPTLRDLVLDDLSRAHPDVRDCATRVDILRYGHAMVRPTPGFLSGPARQVVSRFGEGLVYAHSDLSGLPLFEEAQHHGVSAADRVLARLGRD